MELAVKTASHLVEQLVVPSVLPESSKSTLLCQLIGSYLVHSIGGCFFYLFSAGSSYLYFFHWKKATYFPESLKHLSKQELNQQMFNEITYALWSIPIMALLMMWFPLLLINGYGKVYDNVDDYGYGYLIFSVFFFLFFTDGMIYFIHRGLHSPLLYKPIHKPHHRYRFTTPFSSHSFHPCDGFGQGVPYYIFALLFPIQKDLFALMFIFVNFWTVSIHDQVDFLGESWINSTGHHTLHHTEFLYNYGQYFTFWDWLCGTYKPATQTHDLGTGVRVSAGELNNEVQLNNEANNVNNKKKAD